MFYNRQTNKSSYPWVYQVSVIALPHRDRPHGLCLSGSSVRSEVFAERPHGDLVRTKLYACFLEVSVLQLKGDAWSIQLISRTDVVLRANVQGARASNLEPYRTEKGKCSLSKQTYPVKTLASSSSLMRE